MNTMEPPETRLPIDDTQVREALNTAIAATERRDYAGALKLFRLVQKNSGREIPPRALSYYGLCLVNAERQTKQAVEAAEIARKEEFFESRHWANLVRIYLAGGSRRRAVTILHEGLERMPNDPVLMRVRDEMGYRRRSAVPFLHRDNPLNVFFGKRRDHEGPGKAVKIALGIIWFVGLMALTLYFLMRSSGF